MCANRLFKSLLILAGPSLLMSGCTISSGTPHYSDSPQSGIYGRAYSIPPGTTQATFNPAASAGHYFNVESPDRSALVTTVVVGGDGSYRVDLPPGRYYVDTGDRDSLAGLVQIPARSYLRMDLVLKQ